MSEIVERARIFALAAHAAVGQTRKYTGEPYWHHLREVVEILSHNAIKHDDEMLAAAWLHDVLEDTAVTPELLRSIFGDEITSMVLSLTDTNDQGNRKQRVATSRVRLAVSSGRIQTIKLADVMSNIRNIASLDPKFAQVYLAEKGLLLDELVQADPILQINTRAMLAGQLAQLSTQATVSA